MKKKILVMLCFVFIGVITLYTQTFAARVSECPCNFKEVKYYTRTTTYIDDVIMTEFEVYDVENIYSKTGRYENRIHFNFESDKSPWLKLICYNSGGMPIKTLDFDWYMKYIDVPDITATVEIVPKSPGTGTDTYYHCKYVNVYAPDGRVMAITDLQVPVYKTVGWYPEVEVYADDGRTMYISPFQIDEYRKVGWFTAEESLYRSVQRHYNQYKAAGNYKAIMELVDKNLADLGGTEYASSLYAMRTDAMDCWRKSSNSPLPSYKYSVSENSIGTPEVSISFTNVSYKKIVAFKLDFTCYNIFGSVENSYYDWYYCDDADINPGESDSITWTLYGADSVNTVKNIYVYEVVFADGTKWYR